MAVPKKIRIGGGGGAARGGEADESAVRWLISYADFMMQLVCLFILLFSVSTIEKSRLQAVVNAWRREVGLPLLVIDRTSGDLEPTTVRPEQLADRIQMELGRIPEGRVLRVLKTPEGFRLVVAAGLFREGAADLTVEGRDLLATVAWLLAPYRNLIASIEVAGHAAAGEAEGEPAAVRRLCLDRARAGIRGLSVALPEEMLVAAARGTANPIADDSRATERSRNMRVDFRVHLRK